MVAGIATWTGRAESMATKTKTKATYAGLTAPAVEGRVAAEIEGAVLAAAQQPVIAKPTLFKHYSQVPEGAWRWPNFPPAEIACRGTGELLVDPDALDKLQALRRFLGKPMMISSGYRSPKHNRKVGGEPDSQHLFGRAFDISMSNHDPAAFEAAARAAGFTGFGHYPRARVPFMHVDTGPARTWGEPWPPTATPFPVEPPPVREDLGESRTIGGAKVAAGGVAASEIVEAPEIADLADRAHSWSSLLPDGSTLKYLLLGLAVIGLAIVVYARWDDFRKGKR